MEYRKMVASFLCLFSAWIIFTASLTLQELLVGGICATFVSLLSYKLFTKRPFEMIHPKRIAYFLAYIPMYILAEIKSHLNVAYRIIHPNLPIKPSIVKIPTEFKSDIGMTALANSITMTPGTLTVDLSEENSDLYVHWINTQYEQEKEIKKGIVNPYGKYLEEGLE